MRLREEEVVFNQPLVGRILKAPSWLWGGGVGDTSQLVRGVPYEFGITAVGGL